MDPRDRKYYLKWGWTRQKGKGRYIFTRGVIYGCFLLCMRVVADLFRDSSAVLEQLESLTEAEYMLPVLGLFILMLLAGFVVAWCFWLGRESRFKQIVDETPAEELPYLNKYEKRR